MLMRRCFPIVVAAVAVFGLSVPPAFPHAGHARKEEHPEPEKKEEGRWQPPSPVTEEGEQSSLPDVPLQIYPDPIPDGGPEFSYGVGTPPTQDLPRGDAEGREKGGRSEKNSGEGGGGYASGGYGRRDPGLPDGAGERAGRDAGEAEEEDGEQSQSGLSEKERRLIAGFEAVVMNFLKKNAPKGIWKLRDEREERMLSLRFDYVDRDTIWPESSRKHFGCVHFSADGRDYDVDFFVDPADALSPVKEYPIHRVNGASRFEYDADSRRIPVGGTTLQDARFNFESVVRAFVVKNNRDGKWRFKEKHGTWLLVFKSADASTVKKTGWEKFSGLVRFAQGTRKVELEFTVDFADWKVIKVVLKSVDGKERPPLSP